MAELTDLKGIGEKILEKLALLKIKSVWDLVNFLPKNYIDLDSATDLTLAGEGDFVLLKLRVIYTSKPFKKGRLSMFTARGFTDNGETVTLKWFNSNFIAKLLSVDKVIRCFGKLSAEDGYKLINPSYEEFSEEETKFSGIKPVYPLKGIIKQAAFQKLVLNALKKQTFKSIIDGNTDDLNAAYRKIHSPERIDEAKRAAERIILEETVIRICAFRLYKPLRGIYYADNRAALSALTDSLPFKLTETQTDAVDRITSALLSEKPLNAILVGDVGSGKTAVSLIAAYFATLSKKQAAVLAPTEILAAQHYGFFSKYLKPLGINCELLTGSMKPSEKTAVKKRLKTGATDIAIGTHAIFSKGVEFKDLSLAVMDEQHRFGVAQRARLAEKGENPDILTLSATPIPRTLRLTMFRDVDVIHIENRFLRDNIKTALVPKSKRYAMFDYIADESAKGRQAFIVAPLIYDAEGVEYDSAAGLYAELTERYGKRVKFVLLHGKQKAEEKAKAIADFSEKRADVLISTTVIEVGIDVPDAAIIAVLNAEQFGLASLHQLRGRIGRNGKEAHCFLYTERTGDTELYRLSCLIGETDGFRLAEKDYELRGAGEWLGEEQSGNGFSPSIKIMEEGKKLAETVDTDKHLELLTAYYRKLGLKNVGLN